MCPISVLVIDDHPLMREMWSMLLQSNEKFRVLSYSGLQTDALVTVQKERPDIILLDVNMTPLSGYELLPGILHRSPASRVIALTTHASPVYASKMLRAGAHSYVTKTAGLEELLKAISETMKGKTYIDPSLRDDFPEMNSGPN